MKSLLTIILVVLNAWALVSQDINIYSEKHNGGFSLYADNDEYCPVSIELNLELQNLTSSSGADRIMVVPAKTNGFPLTVLEVADRYKESGYSSYNRACLGDITSLDIDKYHSYHLPFGPGRSFRVSQGYNGSFSHQDINALDFAMPVGTEVYAAREGIVVKVVEKNSRNCLKKNCVEYNNLILIYHPDGTFGDYAHLKKNGALVREGDHVVTGQLIGYSGNTGYSSDPHLHFEVFLQKMDSRKSIRTRFITGDGETNEYLEEGKEYWRGY